ncbi:hypothetical protein [uncultured Clostridium sp.]|uniref:hypothetical protein n=1 Tax=uncultured Clostridium sp. TaxID=59620 RepID=UPI00261F7060|nr:hypothetical protein [uncultured Clostridium sp.]
MKVLCDDCKKEFTIKKKNIKTEKLFNKVERTYFCCPKCDKKYLISYVDKEKKENIKSLKELKGKIIYSNEKGKLQIVYDVNGDYLRIEDLSLKGKRRYLDINGNNVSNKIENGKQKGRSKAEYESITHFKNKDGKN